MLGTIRVPIGAACALVLCLTAAPGAGAATHADFNGDGYADLAISAPGEHFKEGGSGSVHVLYGSSTGVSLDGDRRFTPRMLRGPEGRGGGFFGYALAIGDFDADGYDDLAAASGEEVRFKRGKAQGAVHVLYGSERGLRLRRNQRITGATKGIGAKSGFPEGLGGELAAGDFNRDGRDDLAIEGPGEGGHNNHHYPDGGVFVLFGTDGGLTGRGSQRLTRGDTTHGRRDGAAWFGSSLAAGHFGRGSADDLAVGAVRERVGDVKWAGAVHIFYGSKRRSLRQSDQRISKESPGIAGEPDSVFSEFGTRLLATDLTGDGRDELTIEARSESTEPEDSNSGSGALPPVLPDDEPWRYYQGAVHVLYSGTDGLRTKGSEHITPDASSPKSESLRLAGSADLNADGASELALALYQGGDGYGSQIFFGAVEGLRTDDPWRIDQDTPGVVGDDKDPGDYFGDQFGGADFDGDGTEEALIGEWQFWEETTPSCADKTGAAHVLELDAAERTVLSDLFLTPDTPGIAGDGGEACDEFGYSLVPGASGH